MGVILGVVDSKIVETKQKNLLKLTRRSTDISSTDISSTDISSTDISSTDISSRLYVQIKS